MTGTRLIVKVGGAVATEYTQTILDLARSNEVCVVHGAGPQISSEMHRLGIPVEFVGGRRRTSQRGIEVVRESFAEVNAQLCAAIGPAAQPVFGDRAGILAVPVPPLGLVGDPVPCRPRAILDAFADNKIPVVAPLAVGPLNVNADEAAAALALGLGASRLLFLTDVEGLFVDGDVVDSIDVTAANLLLPALEGGMVPKLRAAAIAAGSGVSAEIGRTAVIAA